MSGSSVTCSLFTEATGVLLSSISAADLGTLASPILVSGGIAIVVADGLSHHTFKNLALTNEAPTPAPSAPTLMPTVNSIECSANTCSELGPVWGEQKIATDAVRGV